MILKSKRHSLLLSAFGFLLGGCAPSGWPTGAGNAKQVQGTLYDSFDVSPDGTRAVFSANGNGGKDLYLLDLRTRRVTRLTDTPAYENYPAFSPDGRSIVYQSAHNLSAPRCLFIRSLSDGRVRPLTGGAMVNDEYPYFSRDGQRVVFSRAQSFYADKRGENTWDKRDVYTINANGTGLRRLTHINSPGVIRPKFSPDGTFILFEQTTMSPVDYSMTGPIARIDTAGAGPIRPVVQSDGDAFAPYFFPDGQRIVFSLNSGEVDVCTMPLSGGTPVCLGTTRDGSGGSQSVVTADGKTIFYYQNGLWQMNADGTGQRRIAGIDLFSDPEHWKP